jgi:hypothetical protein
VPRVWKTWLLFWAKAQPIRKLKVEDIIDERVVRKLEKEGAF